MANLIPSGIDGSSGQKKQLASGDILINSAGNPLNAMTLVEAKEITSNTQATTFSGLDGNVDILYMLQYYWVNGTGAAPQVNISLEPNGLSSNQTGFQFNFASGGSTAAISSLQLSSFAGATGRCYGTAWLWAQADNPGSTAVPRAFRSDWSIFTTSMSGGLRCDSLWNDTSTNITSLVVQGNLANSLGTGSVYTLYKLLI